MKKILALMLAVFMLAGMFSAIPVMAEEDADVLIWESLETLKPILLY